MPLANINNINIYYEIHGEGEPLVLIAGLASDSQSWQFVINSLSEHFKTIVFDNRGVGRSDTPKPPYTVTQMAKDTISLMDHLKIERAHILGHSLGGFIAQEIAINYPERIYKLILESTAPFSFERNTYLLYNFYQAWKSGMDMELWFRDFCFWMFSPKTIANKKFMDSLIRYNLEYPYPQPIEGFLGQIIAIENFNSSDKLFKIQAETLILIGEEDIMIRAKEAELLYQGISRATYPIYIDKAAHSIQAEASKAFSNSVLGFLYKYVR